MEEETHDMSSDLFDQIDDLLDFPAEDIGATVGDDLQSWPSDDMFGVTGFTFSECSSQHELSVPCEDIAELEWLSNFVEASFSAGNVESEFQNSNSSTEDTLFRTSSTVSVLESTISSMQDVVTTVPGRARTKRPRPPVLPPRPTTITTTTTTTMISPSSSTTNSSCEYSAEAESFAESKAAKGDRKKMKSAEKTDMSVRKCLHCGSQKTPQWRMGPLGPKTLCNACGVRHKSGRLFPEYRPAASPTFVASKHSNSHRKVMEMRVRRRVMVEDHQPALTRRWSWCTRGTQLPVICEVAGVR